MLVEKLCREEEVGFVDLWGSFVGRADMYMKDGLHLSGKGAAVFADGLAESVDSGMGSVSNILVVNTIYFVVGAVVTATADVSMCSYVQLNY